MAKFFIVVPTHNSAQYLERCLASILLVQHSDHDVHVHIQDNESTDGTRDIAEAWSVRGVTFKSEKDEGLYDALAKATSFLSAGYIMTWLGSDDVLMPGALATVASVFETFPEISWVSGSPFVGSDADGNFTPEWRAQYWRTDLVSGWHDGRSRGFVMQEGTFWRSDLWLQAGGIDRKYCFAGDWDLWRRFAKFAPLYMLSFPLARFSIRKGQKSSDMRGYYKEVDAAPPLSASVEESAYRLTRSMGETWKIEAESKERFESDVVAGCFSLIGFDVLEGPYPEIKIPRIRWALGPSAQIKIRKGCRPKLARLRVGTWLENQKIEVNLGNSTIGSYSVPVINQNGFCFTEIVVDLSDLNDEDGLTLQFSTWQKHGQRPIAVMLSGLEET